MRPNAQGDYDIAKVWTFIIAQSHFVSSVTPKVILSILRHFRSLSTILVFYSVILAKGVWTPIAHTPLAKIPESKRNRM